MKKILYLCLAVVMMVAVMSGCGQNGGKSTADTDVLYHLFISEPYVTLDPSVEQSNGIMVLQNVYESLTRYNAETKEVEPSLATDWSVDEDGTTWVFNLRDDVIFHDGTKLNAESVVKSINRTIDLGMGSAYIWDSVESIEATGDNQVTFHLTYAAPLDLISSAGNAAYIMSDSVLDKDVEWFNSGNDGGSGPYTITQTTGDSVVLTAFEDYRGGWKDEQYKKILIKETSESSARRQMLETGEAQIACDFSSTDLNALRDMKDKVNIYEAGTFVNVLLCLNTESEPMSNVDFRRAIAYAFPYQETIDNVLPGTGTQSYGLIPDGLWGHDESLPRLSTDLVKAKEYLDASGLDYEGMTIQMNYPTGFDEYANWGQLLQSNLKQLGVNLELHSMEWDAQWAQAQNNDPATRQDIFVQQWWPDYPSPASWFDILVHSEESINFNFAYLNDPELDAKCEEANKLVIPDRDAAEKIYIEIQKQLLEENQYVVPYDLKRVYAVSPILSGVYENPAYAYAIQYYNVTHK